MSSQTALDNSFSILSESTDKDIYLPLWIETFRLRLDPLLDKLSNVVAKNRRRKRFLKSLKNPLIWNIYTNTNINCLTTCRGIIHSIYCNKKYIPFLTFNQVTAGFRQSSPNYECGEDIRKWRDVARFASSEFKRYPKPISRLRQAACDGRWVSYYYRHSWKFREKWRPDSPSTFTRKGKNSSKLRMI